jgi:hypothetical protein
VNNKLAMDAVSLERIMEAFPESDDEDESCGSDENAENGGSDGGSDVSDGIESNNRDNYLSAGVIDRGYTA